MSLIDELAQLHELQKVDTQIYQREQALRSLDSGEAAKQSAIDIIKRYDVAVARVKSLETDQRNRELELKGIEEKRAVVHEKLYSGRITNPKELGDLQAEEDMLDDHISNLETPILELMETIEAAKAEEQSLEEQLSTAKRKWKSIVTNTQAETARLQQEIADLQPERAARAAEVSDRALLRRYDDIRKSREGLGLAVTGNDTCPACHIKLTPHLVNLLREGEEVVICESCGRILAWQRD